MVKFKSVANDTQAMYGTRSHEAVLEKKEKLTMVRMIVITIKIISTRARAGEWKLKNKMLHQKFRKSWRANKVYAFRLSISGALFVQIRANEIPMRK
jgi:hypothetical protein